VLRNLVLVPLVARYFFKQPSCLGAIGWTISKAASPTYRCHWLDSFTMQPPCQGAIGWTLFPSSLPYLCRIGSLLYLGAIGWNLFTSSLSYLCHWFDSFPKQPSCLCAIGWTLSTSRLHELHVGAICWTFPPKPPPLPRCYWLDSFPKQLPLPTCRTL